MYKKIKVIFLLLVFVVLFSNVHADWTTVLTISPDIQYWYPVTNDTYEPSGSIRSYSVIWPQYASINNQGFQARYINLDARSWALDGLNFNGVTTYVYRCADRAFYYCEASNSTCTGATKDAFVSGPGTFGYIGVTAYEYVIAKHQLGHNYIDPFSLVTKYTSFGGGNSLGNAFSPFPTLFNCPSPNNKQS